MAAAIVLLPLATYSDISNSADSHFESAGSQPVSGLSIEEQSRFSKGRTEFSARWVAPFVSGGHWGRGPHSNAASCSECHVRNGRGRIPNSAAEAPQSVVLRLSVPDRGDRGSHPHPVYGSQLNLSGITGQIMEEGDFRVHWETHSVALSDGRRIELRKPSVRVRSLWYGPLGAETVVSLRLAQPVYGLGLLEAVSDQTLRERAERERGVNGRLNLVQDHVRSAISIGRFGHKAMHPTLAQQVAAAFLDEIGVTSSIYPSDTCPQIETECLRIERISTVEARDEQLAAITDYLRMLAPPQRRHTDDPEVRHGEMIFRMVGCTNCHAPELRTGNHSPVPALNDRVIHPYSDLLLHDMGDGLADAHTEYLASGRDWRTPPLWGLGAHDYINGNANFLHDGRARTVTEAILWHGGEAAASREAFATLSAKERSALLKFLDSL